MMNTTTNKRIIMLTIVIATVIMMLASAKAYASTEFTNIKDAGNRVLSGINSHNSKFNVKFVSTSANGNKIGKKIFKKAVNMSNMKDYIEYGVYSKYSVNWQRLSYGDGNYHYTFTYKITYKMTKTQSKAFEKKLTKTVKNLNLAGKSDKAKVKKIYNWITRNVKYDKTSSGKIKYTAFAALNKKKAVCQGYALLFYRMCKEAGVRSNIITGTSHNENHAWNIVKVGKKYKNCDSTWDAGKAQKNYRYFLKTDKKFRKDHKRSSSYSTSAFYKAHPMA